MKVDMKASRGTKGTNERSSKKGGGILKYGHCIVYICMKIALSNTFPFLITIHNKIHLRRLQKRMFMKEPSVKITLAQASKMVISKSDTYVEKKNRYKQ